MCLCFVEYALLSRRVMPRTISRAAYLVPFSQRWRRPQLCRLRSSSSSAIGLLLLHQTNVVLSFKWMKIASPHSISRAVRSSTRRAQRAGDERRASTADSRQSLETRLGGVASVTGVAGCWGVGCWWLQASRRGIDVCANDNICKAAGQPQVCE